MLCSMVGFVFFLITLARISSLGVEPRLGFFFDFLSFDWGREVIIKYYESLKLNKIIKLFDHKAGF